MTLIETFNLAVENHAKNNIEVAIDLYNKTLKIDPNHINSHCNLGDIFSALSEYKKAITCFEKAIKIIKIFFIKT